MAVNTIKTLELSFEGQNYECQLTRAALIDSPETETLTTFCGVQDSSIAKYSLEIGGFQDYGHMTSGGTPVADSVFDLLHEAYVAEQANSGAGTLACVLTVGTATRTFDAVPVNDPPFGGDAGAALTGDLTLTVVSPVTDGP
jgi:hypothetical protein